MEPKIIVHCKGDKEVNELLKYLESAGYKWNGDGIKPTEIKANVGNYIYIYDNEYGKVLRYSNVCPEQQFVEYGDVRDDMLKLLK